MTKDITSIEYKVTNDDDTEILFTIYFENFNSTDGDSLNYRRIKDVRAGLLNVSRLQTDDDGEKYIYKFIVILL